MLTAAAVFGALAVVMPAVSAALGLLGALLMPVGAAIAIFAGLAVLIIANWGKVGPFFEQIWDGIKGIFSGTLACIKGGFQLAGDGLKAIFAGLGSVAGGAWNLVKASWTDFISCVDGWTNGALTPASNRAARTCHWCRTEARCWDGHRAVSSRYIPPNLTQSRQTSSDSAGDRQRPTTESMRQR